MRFSAAHLEFTTRLCRQPDVAGIRRVQDTGDTLEGIRVCIRFEHIPHQLQTECAQLAPPCPACAEVIAACAVAAGTAAPELTPPPLTVDYISGRIGPGSATMPHRQVDPRVGKRHADKPFD